MADLVILSTSNASMSDYPYLLQASGGDPAISITGQDMRILPDALMQSGVCGMGDFRVTQRAAGANLTVDVAAGKAAILGTSVTRQGKFVADSTATVNTGTAGNITVPGSGTRTHRVILRARDKQASGTTYGYSIEVLEDTGSGMPALPASSIDLASVAVPAGSASVTDAMITDRRSYACPSVPLAMTNISVDTAAVTFSGIPGFIRGLELHWTTRSTAVGAAFVLAVRINSDGGTNYGRIFRTLTGNGTATPASSQTADINTYIRAGIIPGSSIGAGIFGGGRVTFPKWRNDGVTTRVSANYESGYWEGGTNCAQEDGYGYWVGTANPTSITVLPSIGSLLAGSQFVLKALA